jgi:hypothetical protein
MLVSRDVTWGGACMLGTIVVSVLRAVFAVANVILLLILELVAAMLVYIYLNLFHLDTFGTLVRFAKYVLDALLGQMEIWAPASANTAYATLVGELGPKSILLLLIGLVTGAIVRFLVRLLSRVVSRATRSRAVEERA